MNVQKTEQPLINTLKKTSRVLAPKGLHIAGLVRIQNSVSTYQDNQRDIFKLTFRLKDNPSAYIFQDFGATLGGDLAKFLKIACPDLPEDPDVDLAFRKFKELENNWFQIMLDHKISKVKKLPYAYILNHTILPISSDMSKTWEKPRMYFELWEQKKMDKTPLEFL